MTDRLHQALGRCWCDKCHTIEEAIRLNEPADDVPYQLFCHRLPECFGRSSCPREYACND